MTHGFDNKEASYDAMGNKSDWWMADGLSLFQIVGDYWHRSILSADEGTYLNGSFVSFLHGFAIDDTGTEGTCE